MSHDETARRIVDQEVYYCVSSLMSSIAEIMWDCASFKNAFGDEEDLTRLYVQDDWMEVVSNFIQEEADMEQLEEIADEYGYWSDIVEEIPKVYPIYCLGNGDRFCFLGAKRVYDNEDRAIKSRNEKYMTQYRKKVEELVNESEGAYEWVGHQYDLDPYRNEVYEHWIVSGWLEDKLKSRGEVVGDFAGLTLWGRCTTGQSIYMDNVIQEIAAEMDRR